VIVTDIAMQAPGMGSDATASQTRTAVGASRTYNGTAGTKHAGGVFGPAVSPGYGVNAGANYQPAFAIASVDHMLSTIVPRRLGPVVAMASAHPAGGVWFAAASNQLTLFHLSDRGKLRSVRLATPGSSPRSATGLGLAVSSSGVVWISVSATLIRYDPRSAIVSSWQVPAVPSRRPPPRIVYSVAVGPDGEVALATSQSSSVQVLDPRSGTFSDYLLPDRTDEPLAVGYAQDGTLGVGYLHGSHISKVMLIRPSGARLTATVAESSAVTPYGRSGLLVGTGLPDVVSSTGKVRPLALPTGTRSAARSSPPPISLPGDRLGVVLDAGIVTFPAQAASGAAATRESRLWRLPQGRCPSTQACPAGFLIVAADGAGDVWVVPRADPYAVVLLRLD